MPVNQHNVSLEVRPLKFLYTKYAPQAKTLCCPVRPLGIVRTESNSGDRDIFLSFSNLEELSDVERVERFLAMSQDTTNTDMYLERSPNEVPSLPEVPNGTHLSRTQAFENKYKLVASRASENYKTQNDYSKRVIQLPMLKINLETRENEKRESKALETTRKSLRKIIDVGRNATKAAGIINYQFKTPWQSLSELNSYANSVVTSVRTNKSKKVGFNHETTQENDTVRSLVNKGDLKLESVRDEKSRNESQIDEITNDSEDENYSASEDDRASVMANRLSSAATLGTSRALTESQSLDDSVGSGQTNSEVSSKRKRSGNKTNVNEHSFELPQWPNQDDVKTPITETNSVVQHNYFQKPKIAKQKIPRIAPIRLLDDSTDNLVITNGENSYFPKLQYTLTASKTKLNPIPAPPRSCLECPICSLFRHKETTPCPPNTPRPEGERAKTTTTQEPFNKNVLSEIDLSTNVDNSICDSSGSDTARSQTKGDKSTKDSNSSKKIKSIDHVIPKNVSSKYRFGYIESSETTR